MHPLDISLFARLKSGGSKVALYAVATMALTGGALARLQELTPPGTTAQIDVSITDEYPLAQAFVIISAVPRP